MNFKNYWAISEDSNEDLRYTDNIHKIMEEQCKYLFQYTKGDIFAVFGEIGVEGSMVETAKKLSTILRGVANRAGLQETIAESSTKNLIDANNMYVDKRYGFEICTEKYRFRLFELKMTPIYPIEISIDEGICNNIKNELARVTTPMEKSNHFEINDEESFCNVLQYILQDRKVRYIIAELKKRVQYEKQEDNYLPVKIIICEGRNDEIILQAIAKKLNQKVTIAVANGEHNVPAIFHAIEEKNVNSNILIVIDSDGDEEETKKMILEQINSNNYELAIINNSIEDWFMPKVADFSKLKLMQSISAIIEEVDWEELSKNHKSFAKVVEFLKK